MDSAERRRNHGAVVTLRETPTASVLIVDDASSVRGAMRELLERRGYHVAGEADSVASALSQVELLTPDAILLDVHLPDGNGFELSGRLRESHPGVAILLTSADCEIDFYARANACGARGFVPKAQLGQLDLERFWPGCSGRITVAPAARRAEPPR